MTNMTEFQFLSSDGHTQLHGMLWEPTDTPVLFVAGDKDPVGSCGKGVIQSYEAFKAAGVRDCTLKLYPGLRHEILNEKPQRDQITQDIETWLLSRLP